MEAKYKEFEEFDWKNERWQSYYEGLYPTPNHRQVLKFKKKWYKRNIDAEFDDTYENTPTTGSDGGGPSSFRPPGGGDAAPPPRYENQSSSYAQGTTVGGSDKWRSGGHGATLCFLVYAAGLSLSLAALAGLCNVTPALGAHLFGFFCEVLAAHGRIKFNTDYLRSVLSDDIGVTPFMVLPLMMPGIHRAMSVLALVPPSLTVLLSFAQICRSHPGPARFLREPFGPLAEISTRYQLLQVRCNMEVALGFALVGGAFMRLAPPLCPLLYWNAIMMRYQTSAWTQASFRRCDAVLSGTIGKIPVLNTVYDKIKALLYSFVDPTRERGGPRCSVL